MPDGQSITTPSSQEMMQPVYAEITAPESYPLPTEPEGMAASLLERFNSGKVSAMMTLYEPEAVLIAKDGRTVTDHTEIAAELERDLQPRPAA
jgi:hypothetical protein